MRQQVIFIHGAEAFSNYEAFLDHLRTVPIDPHYEPVKRWKHTLQADLGERYEVFQPQMPNSQNAKYLEWKIWFERYCAFVGGEAILIGHSQGGYFLAKYLTENSVPFRVKALYLVAAPFEPVDLAGEDGGDFNFDTNALPNLSKRVGKVVIVHSKDDPIVPYSHAEHYQKALPQATVLTLLDRGHFLQSEFPELITHIKAC